MYIKTVWVNESTPAINDTNLNKLEQGIEDAHDLTGDLSLLDTTDKSDMVNSANELYGRDGDLTTLDTTTKTDLVSAINEIKAELQSNIDEIFDPVVAAIALG